MGISLIKTLLMVAVIPTVYGIGDCNKQLLKSDKCLARALLFGNSHAIIPKTVRELETSHCRRIQNEMRCLTEYSSCLKRIPKVLYNILLKNVKSNVKKHCQTQLGKEELITHLRCFNSHNIHILHDLVDKLTLSLSYISKETPVHAFLPHVCCAFNMILEEGKSHVDQLCLKKTGPETGKFFMNVIRSTVADAMDLGCSGHATLDQCQQKIPRAMSIFSNITGVMKEKPGVTPLVPLLEILQKLDSSRDDNDSHRSSNRRG